jgi:hypothetical protein
MILLMANRSKWKQVKTASSQEKIKRQPEAA